MSENDYSLEFIKDLMQEKIEKQIAEHIFDGLEDDEIVAKLLSKDNKRSKK